MSALLNMHFTHIVVTAPHEAVCKVYERHLTALKSQIEWLENSEILCISDPAGKRIGSGGGTLNAIKTVERKYSKAVLKTGKVAIIHSGGDSQRSPLHSVCGKAWASINTSLMPCPTSDGPSSSGYATAFTLILSQLNSICSIMHPGTVLVSCSDVILHLSMIAVEHNKDTLMLPSDCVCAVAIPELFQVAKNHGVFQLASEANEISLGIQLGTNTGVHVAHVYEYFQKPGLADLQKCRYDACAVKTIRSNSATTLSVKGETALIDSGIIMFQGLALEVLLIVGCFIDSVVVSAVLIHMFSLGYCGHFG